jgi:hypothetical protein
MGLRLCHTLEAQTQTLDTKLKSSARDGFIHTGCLVRIRSDSDDWRDYGCVLSVLRAKPSCFRLLAV